MSQTTKRALRSALALRLRVILDDGVNTLDICLKDSEKS